MVETVPFLNFFQTMFQRYLPRCIMKVCNSLAGGKLYTLPFASNRLLMVFALSNGLSRGFFFFD